MLLLCTATAWCYCARLLRAAIACCYCAKSCCCSLLLLPVAAPCCCSLVLLPGAAPYCYALPLLPAAAPCCNSLQIVSAGGFSQRLIANVRLPLRFPQVPTRRTLAGCRTHRTGQQAQRPGHAVATRNGAGGALSQLHPRGTPTPSFLCSGKGQAGNHLRTRARPSSRPNPVSERHARTPCNHDLHKSRPCVECGVNCCPHGMKHCPHGVHH